MSQSQASALSVGGLILDIAGALLLALALITKTPGEAIDATTPRYNFNAVLDLSNAQESADAQAGALLLILGFGGQLGSGLGWELSGEGAVATAIVVALAIDAAAVVLLIRWWRPRRCLDTLAARLTATNEVGSWWPALSVYGTALGVPPAADISVSGMTFAEYGELLLGKRRWNRLIPSGGLPDVMTKLRRDIPGTDEYRAEHPDSE